MKNVFNEREFTTWNQGNDNYIIEIILDNTSLKKWFTKLHILKIILQDWLTKRQGMTIR